MDIKSVQVTQQDIDRVLAAAAPAQPAGIVGDACGVFNQVKPYLQIAITILTVFYPAGAKAVAAVIAIMDKACGG